MTEASREETEGRMGFAHTWGTTAAERDRCFPCDHALPGFNVACFRGVSIGAAPATVFAWLCQLRVGAYSYDWISHPGRHSPRRLDASLQQLAVGQPVMDVFDLVEFERDVHLTLRLRTPGPFPPCAVSYVIVPVGADRCRLVVKLVLKLRPTARDRLAGILAPWLDWFMMRRQLLNLKALSEGASADDGLPPLVERGAASGSQRRQPRSSRWESIADHLNLFAAHRAIYRMLGGRVVGHNILLLTTVGRRTGRERCTPVYYVRDRGDYVIVASNGGEERYPGWWFNLRANERATVQVGRRVQQCLARELPAEQTAAMWPEFIGIYKGYRRYRERTQRPLTMFRLSPRRESNGEKGRFHAGAERAARERPQRRWRCGTGTRRSSPPSASGSLSFSSAVHSFSGSTLGAARAAWTQPQRRRARRSPMLRLPKEGLCEWLYLRSC